MSLKRTTFTELVLYGLILFSIFWVIQSIEFFDSINRVWLAVVSFALGARLFQYHYSALQLGMLMLTVLVHVIAIYFTEFPLYNFNMLFYFLLWVISYVFFAKSKNKIMEILKNSDTYINTVLWVWTILVGVSAFFPSSYDGRYFSSFAGSSFRLMPATLIVTALAMYMAISRNNKWYNLFLILPTYAGFMNRSRTYFIIYCCFVLMYLYMVIQLKRNFYIMLLPLAIVTLALMSVTGIADKLASNQYTEDSYFDFWGTITSGRSMFWKWDLEAFFALPFWQQFVGNGFNFVFDVNAASFAAIWAHNDFINLLMNFGYIGVVVYLWAFFQMVKAFWGESKNVPFLVRMLFLGAVFINSMMNMSYTYMCAMISYPLFLCAISERYCSNQLTAQQHRC